MEMDTQFLKKEREWDEKEKRKNSSIKSVY